MEFVWRAGERPFHVIDITDFTFTTPPDHPRNPGRTWIAGSFAEVDGSYMISSEFYEKQTILNRADIQTYRDIWQKLRAENAPFRIVDDSGLSSAPITYFDDLIVSCVHDKWQRCARVIGETIGKLAENNFAPCGDLVLFSRLVKLINDGMFDSEGDLSTMRTSSVRRLK